MASAVATTPSVAPPLANPACEGFDKRKLIAFICMVFGMFMAILDIQIVSASLAEIQAGHFETVLDRRWSTRCVATNHNA